MNDNIDNVRIIILKRSLKISRIISWIPLDTEPKILAKTNINKLKKYWKQSMHDPFLR